MDKRQFFERCYKRLGDSAEDYLPMLEDYVFATFKARELAEELGDQPATVKIAPRLKDRPDSEHSNPKVRMWALYRDKANELGKILGLIPQAKAGRPAKKKKAFDGDKPLMKTA